MASLGITWDVLLEAAKVHQQDFYELLAEWTIYEKQEYKYLKQNIGFALFGPPTEKRDSQGNDKNTVSVSQALMDSDTDLTDMLCYEQKAQRIVDDIFDTICANGKGFSNSDNICYGLIYNVLLPYISSEKRTKSENQENKEEAEKQVNENTDENPIQLVPIFKIKIRKPADSNTASKKIEELYDVWYIDINCRVYESWIDYKENNTLHKCTMVLPKDGFYQPDPNHPMTETHSVVWLEVEDSPECSAVRTALAIADGSTTAIGVVGICLGAASLVTPVGPAVLTAGALATGVSGIWSFGRSAQNLKDRYQHKQSISPGNLTAFSSWLGIVGGAIGVTAIGSAALLTQAAQNGNKIGPLAKLAYNTILIGNISVSGIGITLQAYNIYENYQETGTVNTLDCLLLGTHILFFGNAVINLKFAGELIKSTQGQVLEEYQKDLRSKRLRKAFNRAKRNAAANNADVTSQNAELIQHINKKRAAAMQSKSYTPTGATYAQFPGGKLTINGTDLIDPMLFATRLLLSWNFDESNELNAEYNEEDSSIIQSLKREVHKLLSEFNSRQGPEREFFDMTDFEPLIQDMKNVDKPEALLRMIFKVTERLIQHCRDLRHFVAHVMLFLWKYVKMNVKQYCGSSIGSRYRNIDKIIHLILEYLDKIIENLISAIFYTLRA